jgi:hypothetical protein
MKGLHNSMKKDKGYYYAVMNAGRDNIYFSRVKAYSIDDAYDKVEGQPAIILKESEVKILNKMIKR